MAIDITIPDLDFVARGSLERDAYVTHQDTQFGILSTTWTTNINLFRDQLNETEISINAKEESCNNLFTLTSTYEALAEQHKIEAQGYASASEASYQNTATLLEDVDITGTAGYTIEAVDDLMSRQRNLQLVGLNLI